MRKASTLAALFVLSFITAVAFAADERSPAILLKDTSTGNYSLYSGNTAVTLSGAAARDPVFAQVAGSCSAGGCAMSTGPKNVSSVSRSAVGQYAVNFAANYASSPTYVVTCNARANGGSGAKRDTVIQAVAQSVFYVNLYEGATLVDGEFWCVVFKDYLSYP